MGHARIGGPWGIRHERYRDHVGFPWGLGPVVSLVAHGM